MRPEVLIYTNLTDMFNIIPLIVILISLAVIIAIVARKFSVLAALDTGTIQAEREAKFKEQIIGKRIKRNFYKYYVKIKNVVRPAGKAIAGLFKWLYSKLIDLKDNNKEREELAVQDSGQAASRLFMEIDDLIKQDKLHDAEQKYIEIIGLDSQNLKAFLGLGDLYFGQKNLDEAKQTYLHALKLSEQNFDQAAKAQKLHQAGLTPATEIQDNTTPLAGIYFDLACVDKAAENYKKALENIKKALKLEPNNPRYLDTWLEISIINKDKGGALDAYGRLKEANPENQKLAEIKAEIDKL